MLLNDVNATLIQRDVKVSMVEKTNPDCVNSNYVTNGKKNAFIRPGAVEYIRRISNHPRVIFGFYSSMIYKNIEQYTDMMLKNEEGIG